MHSTYHVVDDNQPTRKPLKHYFNDEKENNNKIKKKKDIY